MQNCFIYAGRLEKIKGIEILFEACGRMGSQAPHLLVCGTGSLEKWCREFMNEHPYCDIEMRGFVPNNEVKKLIANAKVLILPTQWYEDFPMTVLEAYAVGTPVIGSDFGNVGDLIEQGVTGWKFRYDSVDELIRAVVEITDISPESIRHAFITKYSEQKNIQILEGIYQAINKLQN